MSTSLPVSTQNRSKSFELNLGSRHSLEKSAEEFRESIINDNGLTRGDAQLSI